MTDTSDYLRWFESIRLEDVPLVGGKNASLGELYRGNCLYGAFHCQVVFVMLASFTLVILRGEALDLPLSRYWTDQTNRGEPAMVREASRYDLVFGWVHVGTPTMKQSFASAARLRGGEPILTAALKPCEYAGHRHLGSSSAAVRDERDGCRTLCAPFLVGPGDHAAWRSTTPSGTLPVVTKRHSSMSSLRARATIIVVLRAPLGPSVRALYH